MGVSGYVVHVETVIAGLEVREASGVRAS